MGGSLSYLDHMVGFLPGPVAKAKAVKNLQTAALEPVRLAGKDFRVPLVNDSCTDTAVGHPRSSHQTVANDDVSNRLGLWPVSIRVSLPCWACPNNEPRAESAVD